MIYSPVTVSIGSGKANIHQLRKNSTKPTARAVQIRPQVIFSPFTPFVPFNYESESGDNFIYWSNSDKDFRIINNSIAAPFDFRAISVPFTVELTNVLKHVKVGFYDENGKLKESAETEMIVPKGKGTYASVPGKKVAKKVIKFLESGGSGYVRIVAPLYGSTVPFDIKIPCRK